MNKNGMARLREDFKEEYSFLDWLYSLNENDRYEYLQKNATILEIGEYDPTIIYPKDGETIEDYMNKYNLIDATEIIEQLEIL